MGYSIKLFKKHDEKSNLALRYFFFLQFPAPHIFGQESRKKQSSDEIQIRAALESTAVGWNEGSLEKYLAVYTSDATEMRSNGPRAASKLSRKQ
jgi:hypothetical protein